MTGLDKEVENLIIKELDRVSDQAVSIMKSETSGGPYSEGYLSMSISKLELDKFSREVGSDVEYSTYVENGRGPAAAKNGKALYLKGLGIFRAWVSFAPAQNFLEKTIAKLH